MILQGVVRKRVGKGIYQPLVCFFSAFCVCWQCSYRYCSLADVPPRDARRPQAATTAAGGSGVLLWETLLHLRLPLQAQNMDLL